MSSRQAVAVVSDDTDTDTETDGEIEIVGEELRATPTVDNSGGATHFSSGPPPTVVSNGPLISLDSDEEDPDVWSTREAEQPTEREEPEEDDVQITSVRQTPRQRHFARNGDGGYFLNLPAEQRFVPVARGQRITRRGARAPLRGVRAAAAAADNSTPAMRVRERARDRATSSVQRAQRAQRMAWARQPHALDYGRFARFIQDTFSTMNFNPGWLGAFDPGDGYDEDEMPESIMDEIARREQQIENRRVNSRASVANRMKAQSEKAAKIPEAFRSRLSNGISTTDDTVCVLCGVKLVEGIPEDFEVISDEQEIKHLVLDEKFRAPYQCCKKLTTIDRELSKKIFFGKCGHVYCGRCVNNIMRASKESKAVKQQRARRRRKLTANLDRISVADLDFDDPELSAPTQCVAEGCNKPMKGRYFFRELYV